MYNTVLEAMVNVAPFGVFAIIVLSIISKYMIKLFNNSLKHIKDAHENETISYQKLIVDYDELIQQFNDKSEKYENKIETLTKQLIEAAKAS